MKPRVIIITMGLSRVVQPIVQKHNVVGVIECAPRSKASKERGLLYRVAQKIYSLFKREYETLESYLQKREIPYYYMDNGSDIALERWVKERKPDVIVVYSMSQLLRKNIYSIPKYGTINLHPSFLPKYRGPFPDFWTYYYQDKRGGVTLHFIDDGEDTGDIIYQEEYDIELGMESPKMLDLAVGEIGVKLILKALDNLENLPRKKQPKESPTVRARNIKDSEHKTIIDWQEWDVKRVWHLLRGTQGWLDAIEQPQGIYRGHRWRIAGYRVCDTSEYEVSKIYKRDGDYFVACSNGIIYLELDFSIKKFLLALIG